MIGHGLELLAFVVGTPLAFKVLMHLAVWGE